MSRPPKDEVYCIWQQHLENYDEGFKALRSQCKILKRLATKYPDIVFAMGLSEHDDKLAKKINLNEGKRGHPKTGFIPKSERYADRYKENIHLHIYIGGYYAATLAEELTDKLNKLYHRKIHRNYVEHSAVLAVKPVHDDFPLGYLERQSTNVRYSNKKAVREYAEKRNKITKLPWGMARTSRKIQNF